jgi:hypothetical protein
MDSSSFGNVISAAIIGAIVIAFVLGAALVGIAWLIFG